MLSHHSRSKLLVNFFKYKRKSLQLLTSQLINTIRKFSTVDNNKSKFIFEKPKVLFFGTDDFSLPSLKVLHENSPKTLGVVTSFKQPANCVRVYAEKQGIPLYKWPVTVEHCQAYHLGVVVSFGHLIPQNIIKAFPLGMINVHASILPRWRGAAPIIYAIMNGDSTTGVSIMRIEPLEFDIGEILAQKRVPISYNTKLPELRSTLAQEGSILLKTVVNNFQSYTAKAQSQNNSEVTYAPKVTPELTEVHWSKTTAKNLYQRFRALYGFKALRTRFQNKNVQLVEIRLPQDSFEGKSELKHLEPGSFVYRRDRKCLLVHCGDESYIEVHSLKLEGKKTMAALEFYNGFLRNMKVQNLSFTTKDDKK